MSNLENKKAQDKTNEDIKIERDQLLADVDELSTKQEQISASLNQYKLQKEDIINEIAKEQGNLDSILKKVGNASEEYANKTEELSELNAKLELVNQLILDNQSNLRDIRAEIEKALKMLQDTKDQTSKLQSNLDNNLIEANRNLRIENESLSKDNEQLKLDNSNLLGQKAILAKEVSVQSSNLQAIKKENEDEQVKLSKLKEDETAKLSNLSDIDAQTERASASLREVNDNLDLKLAENEKIILSEEEKLSTAKQNTIIAEKRLADILLKGDSILTREASLADMKADIIEKYSKLGIKNGV